MKRIGFLLLTVSVTWGATAQKVKYDDFYPLLESKQYEQAEGYLRWFVANPKNDDHANSHLHMGYMFENKLLKADILKDTAQLYGWGDSAVLYMAKAKTLIDEKEIKKKDEYYQSFMRRDLRTGEMGIKLSDVHLEIDQRREAAKSRTENIRKVNEGLKKANKAYNEAVGYFSGLNSEFGDYNLLLIKSNEFVKDTLKEIHSKARVSKSALTEMRRALSLIENPGFGPEFSYQDITSFPAEGVNPVDFYAGEYNLWNLQDWSGDTRSKIEDEIEPMKEEIIAYDRELTDYKSNLFAGGTNGKGALTFKEGILGHVQTYDQESILKDIIDIKLMDINILKIYAPTLNTRAADKDDIDYQLEIADSLVGKYDEMGGVVARLASKDLEAAYEKYSFYFDSRMKGRTGLEDFVQSKQREVNEQTEYWKSQYDFWLETSNWALMEFGSIPLFIPDTTITLPNENLQYVTLASTRDDSLRIYPVGIEFGAKTQGYTASIAKNRDGIWYEQLDLGKMNLGDTSLQVSVNFAPSDPDNYTFYYHAPQSEKDNFIIFNMHRSGSLVWRNVLQLEQAPFDIKFNETVYETIIYLDDPENTPPGEAPKYMVIDRTGKLRN